MRLFRSHCVVRLSPNAVVQLPHEVVSIAYLNPFGIQDFETDKLVCVDVKSTDQRGRVLVIEVQIVVQLSFAKRVVFYAREAYTDQLRAGQGYSDLKATYSICLLMRNLWNDKQLHHQFQLIDWESGKVREDSIEIHTVELAKYNRGVGEVRGPRLKWMRNGKSLSLSKKVG